MRSEVRRCGFMSPVSVVSCHTAPVPHLSNGLSNGLAEFPHLCPLAYPAWQAGSGLDCDRLEAQAFRRCFWEKLK